MRRLAKALFAFTPGRSMPAAGQDAFAFATRGASRSGDGSGAFALGRSMLVLAALALAALASLTLAAGASAAPQIGGSGIADFWGNKAKSDAGSGLGGTFPDTGPHGIAVDDGSGDLFVADKDNHRIQQFGADGGFIRAWGFDVVQSGKPGDQGSNVFEVCKVKEDCKKGITSAVGGINPGGELSGPAGIAVNQETRHIYVSDVGFSRVQEFRIDDNGTPADPADDFPAFVRAFGQDVISNGAGSTGFEVCVSAATCKAGTATGALGGVLNAIGFLTIAPEGTPNEGNVLVTDPNRARVQEFTEAGAFERAFGFDVANPAASPATSAVFEVCTDIAQCKAGVSASAAGNGAGQFAASAVNRIAEDGDGRIYTLEAASNKGEGTSDLRLQRFVLSETDEITPEGAFCGAGYAPPTQGGALCGTRSSSSNQNRDNPIDIAVDGEGYVYVVKIFRIGTGNPLATRPGGLTNENILYPFQVRVLKVDPDTEAVARTFLANPGRLPTYLGGLAGILPVANIEGRPVSVGVPASGLPVYAGVPVSGGNSGLPRILRLDDVDGFSAAISHDDLAAASVTLEATVAPATLAQLNTSYRFEYTRRGFGDWSEFRVPESTGAGDVGVDLGNGADGGASPAVNTCSSSPGSRFATCQVSQRVDSLQPGQAYEYRLVGTTEFNGLLYVSDPGEFETSATPPSALTEGASWSGPPASGPSLVFTGVVNPQAAQTKYHFQFVTEAEFGVSGFAGAGSVPPFPRDVGHGSTDVSVTGVAHGLDSAASYVYRLVAENPEGVKFGEARAVEPPRPGDRYLELLTEGDYDEVSSVRLTLADSGDRGMATAFGYLGQPAAPFIINPNIAQRGPDGWSSTPVGPAPADAVGGLVGFAGNGDAAVTRRLWPGRAALGEYQWLARGADGSLASIPPALSPLQRSGDVLPRFAGASPDFSTIAFGLQNGNATLLPGESLGSPNLYALREADTASPSLDVVNRASDGSILGGVCGAQLGGPGSARQAVSADGDTVVFSTRPAAPAAGSCPSLAAPPLRLSKRVEGDSTVAVSASECDRVAPVCAPFGTGTLTLGSKVITDVDTESGSFPEGATGSGDRSSGSPVISNLTVATGAFEAGMRIAGTGIPANATIESVDAGAGTLTLSANVTSTGTGGTLEAGFPIEASLGLFGHFVVKVLSPTQLELNSTAFFSGSGIGLNNGDDRYIAASASGGRVYFMADRQLASSDLDLTSDLYLYDRDEVGDKLTQVSAGEVTDTHPTAGSGAKVLGVAGVSMDGSRVYFVASGKLTPEAADEANNLYVYNAESGTLRFIAKLSPRAAVQSDMADTDLWVQNYGNNGRKAYVLPYYEGLGPARVDGDGHQLLFLSEEKLLPAVDADASDDLYRYDDLAPAGERLSCLSCERDGPFDVVIQGRFEFFAEADQVQQERIASEDGSLVAFATSERLLSADANSAPDGYLWQAPGSGGCSETSLDYLAQASGCLSLVTGAAGDRGIQASETQTPEVSPDGRSVFFQSRATMLPEDVNNGGADWYVARVDGGFPQPEDPDLGDPCKAAGVVCKGEDPLPVASPASPASATLAGAGNFKEKRPSKGRRCPKGKRKVKAANGKTRCVAKRKKAARKAKKRINRANAERRASR